MKFATLTLLSAALCAAGLAQAASPSDAAVQKASSASLREWIEVLALPNDSNVAADIEKNAQWFKAALDKRGFQTQLLPNQGKPMVLATLPPVPGATKTVLFYAHMDGQAVTPSEWQQESPWKPVLKERQADGAWKEIALDQLYGAQPDREWRVFGRSSSDDKAPIIMLMAALDALKQQGLAPSTNIKILLDSEEEKGSPSLGGVIDAHLEALKADALLVLDGPMHASNRPTLVFGNRGVAQATLTVYGASQDLHSGHYSNYAANPAFTMAQLLASMKAPDGRVLVKGYYDGISFDASTQAVMKAVPDDEVALRKRLGIAQAEKVGSNYQEAMQYPSLNVRGLQSADVGAKARTVVPAQAIAELDLRTVPETPPERLLQLLKTHIEGQGFTLIDGEPSTEQRAQYPKLASLKMGGVSASSSAVRTDLNAPIGDWLRQGMQQAWGQAPVQIRMMGGTVPTGAAVQALKVPFVIVPMVNADNNQHSKNENMRLGNYFDGVKSLASILTQPWK
ncbi:M20/M25/M40 family metallo-hydrolase [Comamonas piscis]|uniref:M20/M25/M40 family metallo-hydrolase n=1 Tax=Comamonas piscis TaxID=1562974 RepID=A0A7G5EFC2_9BURK|nr:M20/M25/M40 family metallo-hydrolase [Comamonas piscis]QMV72697.1 M20/M25/M40 family metallo-hydrolase [Comamonas piscis]WSO35468.1 M20/M25/M40 family metallo-hydrolase [Comamonas piscis]